MSWFVMLNGGSNVPLPMVDEYEEVSLFESEKNAAEENSLGTARGYEVYEWFY